MNTKGQPRLRYLFNQVSYRIRKYDPGHAKHRKTGLPSISRDPAMLAAKLVASVATAAIIAVFYLILRSF